MTKTAFALLFIGLLSSTFGCRSGKRWVNAPFRAHEDHEGVRLLEGEPPRKAPAPEPRAPLENPDTRSINPPQRPLSEADFADAKGKRPELSLKGERPRDYEGPLDGQLLGVFRNTYYDFPAESEYAGAPTPLMSSSCKAIARVPRDFHDAVCVQGSGTLLNGRTVSFAKRDCKCAEVCPRTGQKICFDELDAAKFPWGRGAQGTAIVPLRTIAVDSSVIPLGTRVYIPEYDGIERSPGNPARHDGCFIAQDRGMKVVGEHVDIFTGNPSVTKHFNAVVPSNRGVHVYVDTARCKAAVFR